MSEGEEAYCDYHRIHYFYTEEKPHCPMCEIEGKAETPEHRCYCPMCGTMKDITMIEIGNDSKNYTLSCEHERVFLNFPYHDRVFVRETNEQAKRHGRTFPVLLELTDEGWIEPKDRKVHPKTKICYHHNIVYLDDKDRGCPLCDIIKRLYLELEDPLIKESDETLKVMLDGLRSMRDGIPDLWDKLATPEILNAWDKAKELLRKHGVE